MDLWRTVIIYKGPVWPPTRSWSLHINYSFEFHTGPTRYSRDIHEIFTGPTWNLCEVRWNTVETELYSAETEFPTINSSFVKIRWIICEGYVNFRRRFGESNGNPCICGSCGLYSYWEVHTGPTNMWISRLPSMNFVWSAWHCARFVVSLYWREYPFGIHVVVGPVPRANWHMPRVPFPLRI